MSGEQVVPSPGRWLAPGAGPPAAGAGLPGWWYLDNVANNVYYKDLINGWQIQFNIAGGGGGLAAEYVVNGPVAATPVTVTRPNNTTAYAEGQVYGNATDARNAITVPAFLAGSRQTYFSQFVVFCVQTVPSSQGTFTPNFLFFNAQPATVLGDGASIALSDADIQTILPGAVTQSSVPSVNMSSGGGLNMLNLSAGLSGRRGAGSSFSIGQQAAAFVPGSTVWFYVLNNAAYTPLALEQLKIFPIFTTVLSALAAP